jgi:tagatose 1,6-diphosphate aldolase
MTEFHFNDYAPFTDGEIEVVVRSREAANISRSRVPSYEFSICPAGIRVPVGRVGLRIGNTRDIVMHAGHIGYGVDEHYRGHHYAAKACKLIAPVAIDHGLNTLWITCDPDNWASRRTCELLGCELVEIVDLPEDTDMYRDGERQKCRYRWQLEAGHDRR